jgi:hypothetical protein
MANVLEVYVRRSGSKLKRTQERRLLLCTVWMGIDLVTVSKEQVHSVKPTSAEIKVRRMDG